MSDDARRGYTMLARLFLLVGGAFVLLALVQIVGGFRLFNGNPLGVALVVLVIGVLLEWTVRTAPPAGEAPAGEQGPERQGAEEQAAERQGAEELRVGEQGAEERGAEEQGAEEPATDRQRAGERSAEGQSVDQQTRDRG